MFGDPSHTEEAKKLSPSLKNIFGPIMGGGAGVALGAENFQYFVLTSETNYP